MKKLILFIAFGALAFGQYNPGAMYSISKRTTLAAAAEVITIQAPVVGTLPTIQFIGATITSSAACSFTLERDGTSATTTAQTPVQLNPNHPRSAGAARALAFNTSNVGVGTVIKNFDIPAAGTFTLDLTPIVMPASSIANRNFTIRSGTCTATVVINIDWVEL